MSYVNKTFLETQFQNFSNKISEVFARKSDVPDFMTYEETVDALNSDSIQQTTKIPDLCAIRDWCKLAVNQEKEDGQHDNL